MARVSATPTLNNGLKPPVYTYQCRRCGADNFVADAISQRGLTIFHGATLFLHDCRSCGEAYSVNYTIP